MSINKCKKCQLEFVPVSGLKEYCSLKCRNSRVHSAATKLKTSNSLKGRKFVRVRKPKLQEIKLCITCSLPIPDNMSRTRLTCSDTCKRKRLQYAASVQQKHGYGKSGYYNSVWCDSLYELIFLINNPTAKRYVGFVDYVNENGRMSKYVPDFQLGDKVFEIKGRMLPEVDLKLNAAKQAGLDITLIHDPLFFRTEVTRLKRMHNVRCLTELYDDYKPIYDYTCSYCLMPFKSNDKRKTQITFCCREHAGKYRQRK